MSTNVPTLELLIAGLRAKTEIAGNVILADLFEKHKNTLTPHFDYCTQDCRNYPTSAPIEIFGPQFHKAFRQWDVTESSDDDVEIYKYLAGALRFPDEGQPTRYESDIWEVLGDLFKDYKP